MRTRIEAVLNNKDAKAQDYFDLVNMPIKRKPTKL